ncbi:HDOD domain-containing protein [Halothiobacillus sp. DCM-1]|uniref:HDOD domain-containing protein n=1 Tax=Halothiobacillus sp. DCM-1 TaxID=3112558 RepID=UPI0032569629
MINPALEQAIVNKIVEKGIALPVLPDVALRARRIAEAPDSTVQDLADVVAQDPAIAARLIQVANSALYRGTSKIDGLNHVIARLGMRTVSQLIVSLSTQQLFKANHPVVKKAMQDHWSFSAQIGALSHRIAREYTKLDSDQALLAGLLHGVGGIPVIVVAEEIPKLLEAPAVLAELVQNLQPRLGAKIMQAWDFPSMFQEVIRDVADLGYTHEQPANYSDVVISAIAQARNLTETPDGRPITAAQRIGIDLSVNLIDQEIDEAIRALSAGF